MSTAKASPPLLAVEWSTSSWISELPLELISCIVALSLRRTFGHYQRFKALYSMRMVSRMWRDAIDSTPSLWNIVAFEIPLHVNSASIQRSGNCPLDVFITELTFPPRLYHKEDSIELIELAAKEIRRWSTAKIWLPSSDVCSLYLTSPAPLLQDLWLVSESWDTHSAPVSLFGGIAPKLEVLNIEGLPIDWNSPFIRGLRELKISNMINGNISTAQVLDILASTPLLRSFAICASTLGPHVPPSQPGPTIIQLPSLNTIYFDSNNDGATVTILSWIRVPNCTSLTLLDWDHTDVDASSLLGPAIDHFNGFQRRTLSANESSSIHFYDECMEWASGGFSHLKFMLRIRYRAPAEGVRWAARVIGSGGEEVKHDLELTLSHDWLDDEDLAAYGSFSRCQSVGRIRLDDEHYPTKPILELLGTRREIEGGMDLLPAFPGLTSLILASPEGWTFDDLEAMIGRRFGPQGDNSSHHIPKLSIVHLPSWDPVSVPDSKLGLAQLQRVRAAKGVESLTQYLPRHQPGMLAVVYDGDAEQ